ncbi:type IV pili methyl-accepting chemotaxis transducer N-terminal domain-containing protein [Paludibacterium denitrificans]|uniref:type IV pili methyl-accepting chemotaxis transducer N-terminal domain-containing protein n=1 Tax=Paludibacterium denitrificans TaxID=2675226 RepID=UPI001E43841A|nr:type IV pili methyl-accepting chemotaxis transducer N-terminal domain-containing protein [Paludibacterium denitrificans]
MHFSPPDAMRSLSGKLLGLTIVWLLLAMTSIGYTLILSWKLEGGAAAINDAGSLRMRGYRVALMVNEGVDPATIAREEQMFVDIMARLQRGDPSRPLFLPDNTEVRQQAALILQRWQSEVLPMLARAQQAKLNHSAAPLLDITEFVGKIDRPVRLVEEDNANNTTLLRLFQMALMAMAIVGAITMMYLLFLLIIRPLNILGEGIVKLRDGDLSTRIPVEGKR